MNFIDDESSDFIEARQPCHGVELQNENIFVAIQDKPGPAVAFAVDAAVAVGGFVEKPNDKARKKRKNSDQQIGAG